MVTLPSTCSSAFWRCTYCNCLLHNCCCLCRKLSLWLELFMTCCSSSLSSSLCWTLFLVSSLTHLLTWEVKSSRRNWYSRILASYVVSVMLQSEIMARMYTATFEFSYLRCDCVGTISSPPVIFFMHVTCFVLCYILQ